MAYKYKADFPERLLKSMSMGHSFEASMADLKAHKDTGYEWVKKYPKFALAKKDGEAAAIKLLEQIAIADLTGIIPASLKKQGSKKINTTMAIFLMKTRFHKIYGDKMKLEGTTDDKKLEISLNYAKPEKK